MSLITPDFGLLFWMTIIFALLFFILAKFGFPIITSMVESRNDRISESIRLAKEAEKQFAELSEKQAKLIEEARAQQTAILKEASATKDTIIAQAKEQAQAEAAKVIENARVQIAAEKDAAMRDVRNQVALLSMNVAEQVIRKNLSDDKAQVELIDKIVEEIS